MPQAPLLTIRDAVVVRDGRPILSGLSLTVEPGRHTAIVGPNGSGKSTLLKLITHQIYPLARPDGEPVVTIFGHSRWNVFELRAMLGIVTAQMQHEYVGDDSLTGFDAVVSGFFASQGVARHHRVTSAMAERANAALADAEAAHLARTRLATMSTGEARRILIARALAPGPKALILDEPTSGLDMAAARRFLETLRQIAASGRTLVMVTHHVEEILPEIDRVVLLADGAVFRDGPKAEVLTGKHLSTLYGTPIQIAERAGYYRAEFQTP